MDVNIKYVKILRAVLEYELKQDDLILIIRLYRKNYRYIQ